MKRPVTHQRCHVCDGRGCERCGSGFVRHSEQRGLEPVPEEQLTPPERNWHHLVKP